MAGGLLSGPAAPFSCSHRPGRVARRLQCAKTPFSVNDLAEELGYHFFGYTHRFPEPVYARLEIWRPGPGADTPPFPEDAVPPTSVFAPAKPSQVFSVRILRKAEIPEAYTEPAIVINLDYKVDFEAEEAGKDDVRLHKVEDLFSSVVTPREQFPIGHSTIYHDGQRIEKPSGITYSIGAGEDSGVDFPNAGWLQDLAEDLPRPGGVQRVAVARAKWQAEAEAKLLREPVRAYRYA